MDERDELRELTRRLRERLLWQARGGVSGLPRRAKKPAPRAHLASGLASLIAPATPPPLEQAPVPRAPLPPPLPIRPTTDPRGAVGLRVIREDLGECTRCRLASSRRNIVYGVGNPEAPLVFVGEGPGENEDATGEPFVGKAGELLTKMIGAMGFDRGDIYICNVVKCRPPENRNPLPDEIAACEPFLVRQLGAIAPRVIVALGKFAAQTLLRTEVPISALRGRFHQYQGIPLMPTFHPAYLLRNPPAKREVWEDLQLVMAELDRLGVPRGSTPRSGTQ